MLLLISDFIMKDILSSIDKKLQKLYAMRPFSGSEMRKIREVFRIAYNYSSNHIEGNSLTMHETRSLLLLEIDSSSSKAVTEKRKRDEREILGHDEAISQLWLLDKLNFAEDEMKSDLQITHGLIRDLNKMILVENYKKRVIDSNGDQFFVDVVVGQYKTKNNHVQRRNGSLFYFADVSETQSLMQDLINRYTENKDKIHPIALATMFHYKFIRIHPFDDGNGRVCRLLANIILMHYGYPLFIVPPKQKDEYYDMLEYVDGQFENIPDVLQSNDIDKFRPFIEYVAQRIWRSIDHMISMRKQKTKQYIYWGIWLIFIVILGVFYVYKNTIYNNLTMDTSSILIESGNTLVLENSGTAEEYQIKTEAKDDAPWENIYLYDETWNKIFSLINTNDPAPQYFKKIVGNNLIIDYGTSSERIFAVYDISTKQKIFESAYHEAGSGFIINKENILFEYRVVDWKNLAPCSWLDNGYIEKRYFSFSTRKLEKTGNISCTYFE